MLLTLLISLPFCILLINTMFIYDKPLQHKAQKETLAET